MTCQYGVLEPTGQNCPLSTSEVILDVTNHLKWLWLLRNNHSLVWGLWRRPSQGRQRPLLLGVRNCSELVNVNPRRFTRHASTYSLMMKMITLKRMGWKIPADIYLTFLITLSPRNATKTWAGRDNRFLVGPGYQVDSSRPHPMDIMQL